jgi:ribosomal protein S27AE
MVGPEGSPCQPPKGLEVLNLKVFSLSLQQTLAIQVKNSLSKASGSGSDCDRTTMKDPGNQTEQWREWTDAELHKLFKEYFAKLPGTCPVCGHGVGFMTDHSDNTAMLTIRCRFCNNSRNVFI